MAAAPPETAPFAADGSGDDEEEKECRICRVPAEASRPCAPAAAASGSSTTTASSDGLPPAPSADLRYYPSSPLLRLGFRVFRPYLEAGASVSLPPLSTPPQDCPSLS